MQNETQQFCKKIVFNDGSREPTILLGLILGEDSNFIFFRTAKKTHTINKRFIAKIEDTSQVFREVEA